MSDHEAQAATREPNARHLSVNGEKVAYWEWAAEPGNADASVLVQKVEATEAGAFGGPMPPSYTPLTEAELDTVRAWIEAGAPDN